METRRALVSELAGEGWGGATGEDLRLVMIMMPPVLIQLNLRCHPDCQGEDCIAV